MSKYTFYGKSDKTKEPIHVCEALSKEDAEIVFAKVKQLPLDVFKTLYVVDGV